MRALTPAEVDLLKDDEAEQSAGCELLDQSLAVVEDISDDFLGGSTSYGMNRPIHTTAALRFTRPLRWGIDHVRPYVELSKDGVTSRFYRGVFVMVTPTRKVGEVPETYEVEGYDRLYLLSRQVGADYSVAPGTTYRAALLAAFTAAGLTAVLIEGSAADDVVPDRGGGVGHFWPLIPEDATDPDQTLTPTTWLRIINDLLQAVRFRSVWCDELGRFRCQEYQPPKDRAPEFTLDADELLTVVAEDREVIEDPWKMPNRWVFRWRNAPEATPLPDQSYEVLLPADDPMSAANRGLTWTSVVDYDAASRARLVQLGDDRVASDRALTSRYEVTTGPFPVCGHADVYTYRDTEAGVDRKVQLIEADVDLLGGTRMTLEAI